MSVVNSKKKDVFRDTYIRYMGYANEIGESFRPLIHVNFVHASYGIASGYVIADSIDKMYKANNKWNSMNNNIDNKMSFIVKHGIDSLIWQSFASVIIPGITINRTVKLSSNIICKHNKLNNSIFIKKSFPTLIGLISIPFIIHPIDNFVHFVMNRTLRPYIKLNKHF